jgi:hypothetical protein
MKTPRRRWITAPIKKATSYDPNAVAYFTAAGITDTTEKNAVNTFILALKSNNFYTRFDRLWLRSPTSQAASLIDFISLTSSTVVNAPSWSNQGFQYNGTTNYINSGYAISTSSQITNNNGCLMVYVRSGTGATLQILTGANNSVGSNPTSLRITNLSVTHRYTSSTAGAIATGTAASYSGLIAGSRVSNIDNRVFQNGSQIGSTATTANANFLASVNMFIGANNNNATASNFCNMQECYCSFSTSFTTTEMSTFYGLLQTYQTNVIAGGRQV